MTLVEEMLISILKENSQVGEDGLHFHTSLALRSDGGSLRQKLWAALEETMVRALVGVIGMIDVNYCSVLLEEFGHGDESLWFGLARRLICGDASAFVSVLPTRQTVQNQVARNTGKHGTMVARFPFSDLVMEKIGSAQVRHALVEVEERPMEVACCAMLGADIVHAWSEHGLAYLHDVVATSTARFPGISFQAQFELYTIMVRFILGGAVSPHGVHVALWHLQGRLDQLCSFVSHTGLHRMALELESECNKLCSHEASTVQSRLPLLDRATMSAINSIMWKHISSAHECYSIILLYSRICPLFVD